MINQEQIITILYDLSQTISSEVELSPLLKKLLQRLMYHTGYSCGLILSNETGGRQRLQTSIGDIKLKKHSGELFDISNITARGEGNRTLDLTMLPVRQDYYQSLLRLPIPNYGDILLLATWADSDSPPYEQIFAPVLANLTKTITLCKDSEAYTAALIKDKEKLTGDNLLFRQSLDTSSDFIILADLESGNLFDFNKSTTTALCYSDKELNGMSLEDLFTEDSYRGFTDSVKEIQYTKQSLISEFNFRCGDGRSFPVEAHLSILAADDRSPVLIIVASDITERNSIEEQLRRSQKMDALGKLTGGIAHDYNNMLGVVMGFTELLSMALESDPKLSGYLDNIRRAGERGTSLTKKLLSFSRKKASTPTSFNINKMLEDEKSMLEKTLTARISLKLDLTDNIWPIWVDSSDLEDALLNISINAMHSIKDNGNLTITTKNESLDRIQALPLHLDPGDHVSLSIADSGSGMDEETIDKIFDPFYTTKGEMGTGLGLSQVYGFMDRSEGKIQVDSVPGRGSTFTLYFQKYHGAQSEMDEEIIDKKHLKGTENILVIDDEPSLVSFTSEALTQNGYHITSTGDAKEALEILDREPIDLVLSDVIMPKMSGFQLAVIIKEKYPEIKIQLMSGFNSRNEIDKLDDALHENLLSKPFKIADLLTKIRKLLDN